MNQAAPSKKVLVVEDEEDMIFIVERRLKGEGFKVTSAMSGAEALKKLNAERPDVVLLDVVLPDVDGFDLCRQIKTEIDPTIKVIVYTGKLEKVDVALARRSEADELVVKSEDLQTVVNTIQDFFSA